MQDIWLGQTLMKYDNIFYVHLKWIVEGKQTFNCLYSVFILRCHLDRELMKSLQLKSFHVGSFALIES